MSARLSILHLAFVSAVACTGTLGDELVEEQEGADAGASEELCIGADALAFYRDGDGDGFGDLAQSVSGCAAPEGYVDNSDDCDDTDELVSPAAIDVCGDKVDNDCSGGDVCQEALLAQWEFTDHVGGVTPDIGVGGSHAILVNGTTLEDGALVLDGVDDYAYVAHVPAFELAAGSVSLWFQVEASVEARGLLGKDASGLDDGGHLKLSVLEDDSLQLRMQSPTESHYALSQPLSLNTWHQVVFSFGAGGMRLYLDGSLVDVNPYTGGLENNREPIAIGVDTRQSDDGAVTPIVEPMLGKVTSVSWYTRELNEAEVLALHTATQP